MTADFMWNAVPPGGYSYDEDFDEAEENAKCESWSDWLIDCAIEETMIRRKEKQ